MALKISPLFEQSQLLLWTTGGNRGWFTSYCRRRYMTFRCESTNVHQDNGLLGWKIGHLIEREEFYRERSQCRLMSRNLLSGFKDIGTEERSNTDGSHLKVDITDNLSPSPFLFSGKLYQLHQSWKGESLNHDKQDGIQIRVASSPLRISTHKGFCDTEKLGGKIDAKIYFLGLLAH